MKQPLLVLVLLAATPLLGGCEISKSFSIQKDNRHPCGCHGPRHDDHCSHRPKHRPRHTGSHDPHSPDRPDPGHDFFAHRAASSSIARLNHGSIANRSITPRPKPTPSQHRASKDSSTNHAIRADSRRTNANVAKQKSASNKASKKAKKRVSKKHGR